MCGKRLLAMTVLSTSAFALANNTGGLETDASCLRVPPSNEIAAVRASAVTKNPTNAEWPGGDFGSKKYHENITLRFH